VQIALLYAVIQVVSSATIGTIVTAGPGRGMSGSVGVGSALPVSRSVAGLVAVLSIVGSLLLTVIVFRVVAHDPAEFDTIPLDVTDRLGVTAVYLFVANLVVGVAVTICLIRL
jgi:hypothetical protein